MTDKKIKFEPFGAIYLIYLILLSIFYWNTPLGNILVSQMVMLFIWAIVIFFILGIIVLIIYLALIVD